MFPEQHFLRNVKHLRLTIRDCDWREANDKPKDVMVGASDVAELKATRYFGWNWESSYGVCYRFRHYSEEGYFMVIDPFIPYNERSRAFDESGCA